MDRFLVRGIADNAAARRMAALLLDYARESGTRVIGEGIKTAEEFNCLRDMGVELRQGYAIGRPAPRALPGQVPTQQVEMPAAKTKFVQLGRQMNCQ